MVEEIVTLGDAGSVQLTIAPAEAGFNQIHLYTFDPEGRPADIAETVTLELTLPAAQLGPLTREATRAGPAHFQLNGDRPRRRRHLDHRGAGPPRPLHRGDRLRRGAHCRLSLSNAAADAA